MTGVPILTTTRSMGRREATGLIDRKTGEVKRAPKITRDMMNVRVSDARVELRGTGVDESPHCYKRLNEVLDAHSSMVRILPRLRRSVWPWPEPTNAILYKD